MPSSWENLKVDGSDMPLYVSLPASGGPVPGIVVIHGQSGLENFIKDTTHMLALQGYAAVVKADAGRTELSVQALNRLATILARQDKELAALSCLALSLQLDRGNAATLTRAGALLKKQKFLEEPRPAVVGPPSSPFAEALEKAVRE